MHIYTHIYAHINSYTYAHIYAYLRIYKCVSKRFNLVVTDSITLFLRFKPAKNIIMDRHNYGQPYL